MTPSSSIDPHMLTALEKGYGAPLFLLTQGRNAIVAHCMRAGDIDMLHATARALGIGPVTVRRHAPKALTAPRDLQAMLKGLTGGYPILRDPVGGIQLAADIERFTTGLRLALGQRVRGAYFDAPARSLRIWVRPTPGERGSMDDVRDVMRVAETYALDLTIAVTALVPRGRLVAVDAASRSALHRTRMRSRIAGRIGSAAALLGFGATPALAQGLNVEGTVSAGGGIAGSDLFGQGTGQIGAVGNNIYLQADVSGLASESDVSGGGVGGQIGYVDPDRLRAGVFGYGWKLEDYKGWKYGAYGELYLGSVTFRLEGGRIDGELDDADTYGRAKLSFYADDNTKFFAEAGTLDDGWGGGGLEYAFSAMPGLVAGVAGRIGNDDDSARVYVKWYFGGADRTSSLKKMDRSGLAESMFDVYEMRRTVRKARAASYGGGGTAGPIDPGPEL